MNRRLLTLWIAGVCAALALIAVTVILLVARGTAPEKVAVQAQTATQPGQSGVNVQGSGAALVKPDVVKLTAGVEERAPNVTDAQKQAATKIEAITNLVKAQGVKPEDIVTNSYEIYPNYIYNNGQSPRLDGYVVRSQLGLTIRDTSKAGTIIDAIGNAGANLIGGIQFTLDNNSDAVKQARQAAMADAKDKADQLAKLGGFSLGGIISVSEYTSQPPRIASTANDGVASVAASAPAQTVIETGQFKVVVNVQVVYAIKV
jgi:uncharacterized protein YggE